MALTYPIDVSTPAGSDDPKQGDDRIRELKNGIVELTGVDHDVTKTGNIVNGADVGKHKQVSLLEQANIGTGAEGKPILGAQTADGKAELVFTDEADNDVQITKDGKILADSLGGTVPDAAIPTTVKLTGDQTVAGVKTFSSFPVTPSSDPSADCEVANKKYVDKYADHGALAGLSDDDHPQYVKGQESAEIINRGSGSIGSGADATVTFGTSFSSGTSYNIVACLVGSGTYDACLTVKSKSAGSAVLHNGNGVSLTYEYIAIGN